MRARLSILLAVTAVLAACGGSGGSGGGAKLALGTEATVAYTATASGSTPAANTTLGITVTKVRIGSLDDLTAAGLEPDDKNTTPYYVDVHYTNKGNGPVTKNLDVGMEDSDGNSIPTTLDFAFGLVRSRCAKRSPRAPSIQAPATTVARCCSCRRERRPIVCDS